MTFDNVAFVWCGLSWPKVKNRPGTRPVCSVAAWPMVLGCDVIGWDSAMPNAAPADEIRRHDVFLVNLFTDSRHIEQIKRLHPESFVVAMPDPYLELAVYAADTLILEQMALADAIGARVREGVSLYGALFDKPAAWLPSPVGPSGIWDKYWDIPKEDAIIATEHNGYPRSSVATVAALAVLQRRLPDVTIHFYRPSPKTKTAAELAGLQAVWHEAVDYPRMVEATARARWGIDLYGGHSQGRNLLTHAMAGTPVVGSTTNNPHGGPAVDPYCVDDAVAHVVANWKGLRYKHHRRNARAYVEGIYGFDASRRRMAQTLEGFGYG